MRDDLQFHDSSTAATGHGAPLNNHHEEEDEPLVRPDDRQPAPVVGPAYLAIIIGLAASAVALLLFAVICYISWGRSRVRICTV
jgi:hypothetical protein